MSESKIEGRTQLAAALIGALATIISALVTALSAYWPKFGAPTREPQDFDIATAIGITIGALFVLAGLVLILVKRERRQSGATRLKEKIATAYLNALSGSRLNPQVGDGE